MVSTGIDYMPRATNLNSLEKEIMRKFGGLKAYGFLQILENIITRRGSYGYYIYLSKSTIVMIADELHCSVDYCRDIIAFALKIGYFDKAKFEEFRILTNEKIQEIVLVSVYSKRKLNELSQIRKEYILCSIMPKLQKKAVFIDFFGLNSNREEQTKSNILQIHSKEETNTKLLSNSDLIAFLQAFKQEFPFIKIGSVTKISENVNLSLLKEKIYNSAFLQGAKNLSLEWMIKEENYKKIIAGVYDKFKYNKALAPATAPGAHSSPAGTGTPAPGTPSKADELNYLFDKIE